MSEWHRPARPQMPSRYSTVGWSAAGWALAAVSEAPIGAAAAVALVAAWIVLPVAGYLVVLTLEDRGGPDQYAERPQAATGVWVTPFFLGYGIPAVSVALGAGAGLFVGLIVGQLVGCAAAFAAGLIFGFLFRQETFAVGRLTRRLRGRAGGSG